LNYWGLHLKTKRIHIISVIALTALLFISLPVHAQEEEEDLGGAEVNAYISGDIPSITSNWTIIDLQVKDAFGIDWDRLSTSIPKWWMRIFWPLNPSFPQPVQRFLGYTGLRFEPEIIQGDPKGWYLRVVDNEVDKTNPGDVHQVLVEARTDDSAIDYAVVIGVKTYRLDTFGQNIGYSYIKIPVKASPLNFVEMRTTGETTKKVGLKQMVYFDVDITNNGYYRDVFQLELDTDSELLGLADKQAFVLRPGEIGRVQIGILTPEKLFDPGTPNKVDVYAYSAGDPTRVLVGSLVVYTEGIYISPLVGIIATPIVILILLIGGIWYYRIYLKEQKEVMKPQKPWTIPEEKAHLDRLQKEDKKEYEKTMELMQQEYQSALLWYEAYKKSLRAQSKKPSMWQSVKSNLNKPKPKKQQKQPAEEEQALQVAQEQSLIESKEPEEPKEMKKEQPEIVKDQYESIEQKKQEKAQRKQQALRKIRQQQKKRKQKKK